MGHMIEQIALERGHEIVCRIDKPTPAPSLQGGEKIFSPEEGFDSEAFRSADVAIEFTTPATAEENIRKSWELNVPVISGSTGWNAQALIDEDQRLHKKPMLIWKSNFSVGVNIFFELNKQLAAAMAQQPQYTPSIVETHHIHKLDKPSGTAVALANQIAQTDDHVVVKATDGSALPKNVKFSGAPIMTNGIPIESIREGEVPGTHTVTWDSEEDTIVITHIAKGRRGFALGAVLAAEQIKN